jgi:signal transduction histidine kinase
MKSSSRIPWTEKCCHQFSLFYLQLINLLDFVLGAFFLSFTLYLVSALGSEYLNVHVAWLAFFSLTVGILLLLVSLFSFCAISSTSCRSMAYPTDFMAVVIVLIDFASGITAVELQSVVITYLNNHGNEMGLSSSAINTIKSWYLVICAGFFVSLLIEIIRLWLNRGFTYSSRRIDMEYSTLLNEEDRQWEEKMENARTTTSEKYKKLKEHYHKKYNKPVPPVGPEDM